MEIGRQMLERFRKGDIESFYMEMYPSLLRYATRVLGTNHAHFAEDCVQEAIYKVYQKRKQFDRPSELKAFLYTTVHNQIVDIYRKHDRQEQYTKSKEWIEENPIDSFLLQETLDLLYDAISNLPEDLKTIYELTYEQHKKGHEIASMLNISTMTVARQKNRLIEALRRKFKDNGMMQFLITILFSDWMI